MAHRDKHDGITKRRVMNGHGITPSLWSTTHLGSMARPVPYQMPLDAYRAEAHSVSEAVKQRHGPAYRSLHLQKSFPETRRLMQPPNGRLTAVETPRELKDVSFPPHNMHRTRWEQDLKPARETNPAYCKAMQDGFNFGHGHRAVLARRANDTNVNYIISQQDRSGQPFRPGARGSCRCLATVLQFCRTAMPAFTCIHAAVASPHQPQRPSPPRARTHRL